MQPHTDCLTVLAHAAANKALVAVEMRTGEAFADGVCEVFRACGADLVVFHGHNCRLVEDIARCSPVTAHGDTAA